MSDDNSWQTVQQDSGDSNEGNPGQDIDECTSSDHRAMAASYTEIAFQMHHTSKLDTNPDSGDSGTNADADATTEDTNTGSIDESLLPDDDCEMQNANNENPPKRPVSLLCEKSFPYDLEGTVSKEGDMTHFVAENLEYKIKLSSPITKREMGQTASSSRNSTPSTSVGLLPRHFYQPQLAQIDSNVLSDIEIDAQYLAASVDNLTENLYNLLHSISSITADNVEIHKNCVNKLTDSMDANIKCMYTIMAKTEEISKSMKPTEQLALRIREIKRLVDMLESSL